MGLTLIAGCVPALSFFQVQQQQGIRSMIAYVKKADPAPAPKEIEENRFERIRNAAAEKRKKADTDGVRRGDRQPVEDNCPV